jgi:hypothetical protein
VSSIYMVCGRCGGSIGPPPDGAKDHICKDKRPSVEHVEADPSSGEVDPIVEHARRAAGDNVPGREEG